MRFGLMLHIYMLISEMNMRGYVRMVRGGHYRAEPRDCTSESRCPYILESDVEDYGDIQELGFRVVMLNTLL